MEPTGTRVVLVLVSVGLLALWVWVGGADAAVEPFDAYAEHTNATPDLLDPAFRYGAPGDMTYWIYGDAPHNGQSIGSWSWDAPDGGDPLDVNRSDTAGIATHGTDTCAFGAVNGDNPGQLQGLGYMDFGTHSWDMTSGVIADYFGPIGRDLHGGSMDVRLRVVGFSGRIQLGFVSNHDWYIDELDLMAGATAANQNGGRPPHCHSFTVDYEGPVYDATDAFAWYHGDFDDFHLDYSPMTYGSSGRPHLRVLGVWIRLYSNSAAPTLAGQLQVDQIEITPEPATLTLLALGGLLLWFRRRGK